MIKMLKKSTGRLVAAGLVACLATVDAVGANGYLCVTTGSVGFSKKSGNWRPVNISDGSRYVIVKANDRDRDFARSMKMPQPTEYVVKLVGHDFPLYSTCLQTGVGMNCDYGHFEFNQKLLRFVAVSTFSYIAGDIKMPGQSEYMAIGMDIGECSSF